MGFFLQLFFVLENKHSLFHALAQMQTQYAALHTHTQHTHSIKLTKTQSCWRKQILFLLIFSQHFDDKIKFKAETQQRINVY